MCFYHDYEWFASINEVSTRMPGLTSTTTCDECGRVVPLDRSDRLDYCEAAIKLFPVLDDAFLADMLSLEAEDVLAIRNIQRRLKWPGPGGE
jgi:hypothetical protein